mgnify:FL=1
MKKAKSTPVAKPAVSKAKKSAKLRKAKAVKNNHRKQLKKTQKMRMRRGGVKPSKNRCM